MNKSQLGVISDCNRSLKRVLVEVVRVLTVSATSPRHQPTSRRMRGLAPQ